MRSVRSMRGGFIEQERTGVECVCAEIGRDRGLYWAQLRGAHCPSAPTIFPVLVQQTVTGPGTSTSRPFMRPLTGLSGDSK
jgi:hypothetical protein